MPNWCATNYAATGDKAELQKFADMVNSLPSREDVSPNGFGKYWLGNLVTLLGADWEKVSCRGVLNPDPNAGAYLCGPDIADEPDKLSVVETEAGPALFFSTQTAWGPSDDFETLLADNFPSLELSYKSTDEWGNFRALHDPYGLINQPLYNIEIYGYTQGSENGDFELSTNDKEEFVEKTLKALGKEDQIGKIRIHELVDIVSDWCESYGDNPPEYILEIWEEE